MIKDGALGPGNATEGFAFFAVPKDIGKLGGWKVSLVLDHPNNPNKVMLSQALSGFVLAKQSKATVFELHLMR